MAEQKMQLEDWLDDLCVRFIINLPVEDLSSVARICFQVEEAQWFYEDFVRPLDPTLPSMTLRSFSLRIFQHCPLLTNFSVENHTKAFEEFLQYKTRVPVRGAILLNEAMDSTILVKGWKKGANWSFPRGKINKDEDDLECAIREVYEETGYDLHAAGLVPENRDVKYIEVTMREQQLRLYVFRDVPMDTHFQPRTRKEISKIQWYRLSELPAFRKRGGQNQNDAAAAANANKFYMVAPFLVPLKKWVVQQKKKDAVKTTNGPHFLPHSLQDDPVTEDDIWQTELATDISMRTTSLDTLEGATKELQRLLKVQPAATPATLVPVSPDNTGDKGASLLAILQAKNQATAKASPVSQQIPHTPLDASIEDIPQPHSPHGQHHPRQRAPLASYQHPPGFPIAPDATPQSWAFAQPNTVGPVRTQIGLHDAALNHGPAYGHLPPILAHPQPLPPQVQQSYVGSGVAANGTPTNAFEHVQGSGNQRATAVQSQQMHAQSLLYSPKPLAGQLSSQSMALLGVLKSDAKAVSPRAVGATTPNQTLPLGISHEHGVAQRLNGSPGMLLPNPNSTTSLPFAASHQRSQQPASPAHRSALLEMFKKPEPNTFHVDEPAELPASTPSAGLLKGISNTRGQVHERRVDFLINVAGVMGSFSSVDSVSDDEWERVMAVNLTVPVKMMRAVLPVMKENGSGVIVNVASTAALSGAVAGIAYTCSKHGLIGATKNVAWQFRKEGIRCNAELPGAVDSRVGEAVAAGGGESFDAKAYAQVEPVHALHAQASGTDASIAPLEVAQAILFLGTDQARTINGVSLPVDQAWCAV
ncbi:mRNA decapping complex subunit 2 [Colletotrichum spinosum]|uniref:mRNA decapping complex subunit 2 n=1 Tax=Colletotrichum spinosum TaxID=1347390 RepID=A0A4R8Q0N2_9PEZI|nr:mRNA decapping complex subunit 2 [Colletotrichum spinosum]